MRTLALALLAAALTAGCRQERQQAQPVAEAAQPASTPEPAAPKPAEPEPSSEAVRAYNWSAFSADSEVELRQQAEAPGNCRVTCRLGERELWSAERCLGQRLDLRFISRDCERVAVLHPFPRMPGRWQVVELAHVYRRGELDYVVQAAGLLREERRLKRSGVNAYWLQGTMGNPGEPPRYNAEGTQVELVALDGQKLTLPLVSAR
jgi:hypothetical protein